MHLTPHNLSASLTFAIALMFMGCNQTSPEATAGQRAVSQATIDDLDVQMTITSGTFRSATVEDITARSAAPVARFSVVSGPTAGGDITIEVTNIHARSELTLLAVDTLNDAAHTGCPNVATRTSIPCALSLAAVGDPCAAAADCPAGLSCVASQCTRTAALDVCQTPPMTRDAEDPTSVSFVASLTPCTTLQFGLTPPERDVVKFGVVGPTSSLGRLESAIIRLKEEGVDFVAILGENVESSSASAIDALDRRISRLGVSIVYVVGPDADRVSSGRHALTAFGPHDHAFTLHGTRFVTFYSPERELALDGFVTLERALRTSQAHIQTAGTGAIIALTHTPPVDPNGIRDLGFKNHIEGARTLSLLNKFGVSNLFAGHIPAADAKTFGAVTEWLTGSNDSLFESIHEAIMVESRNVAGGDVTVTRIKL